MKLLHPFINTPAIYFPVGKLEEGGTCEFATKNCLAECAVYKHLFCDDILHYRRKEAVYKRVTGQDPLLVASDILNELNETNSNILCWFASGDCPAKDTEQICNVAMLLQMKGINQAMITRSHELYKLVRRKRLESFHATIGIALTTESIDSIDETEAGLLVVPDYKEGSIQFYIHGAGKDLVKTSSFSAYNDQHKRKPVESLSNCRDCLITRKGCFTQDVTEEERESGTSDGMDC